MIRLKFPAVVGLLMLVVAGAIGQDRSMPSLPSDYLISAKAGGVNYVEGAVGVIRVGGKSGVLLAGDNVAVGERVQTDADSRAEILMNPGSYVRLGSYTEFEFETTSLDDLRLKLKSGSAVFEVYATNRFSVKIFTPKGEVELIESGVYRVDVYSDGRGAVSVTSGKALVGESGTIVKEGRTGTVGPGEVVIAKFDKSRLDDLSAWSRSRAKDLAKLTASLKNKTLANALAGSLLRRGWGFQDSFGLWVYDPFSRRHCFLPFGRGWGSPYGYWYDNGLYWYNLPQVIGSLPIRQPPLDPPETVKTGRLGSRFYEPPPYFELEKTRSSSSIRSNSNNNDGFVNDSSSVRSSSSSSAPTFSAPPAPAPVESKRPN